MECVVYGPRALLIRFARDVGEPALAMQLALLDALRDNPVPGLREVVPAFTTLLLEWDPAVEVDLEEWRERLLERLAPVVPKPLPAPEPREIPVFYDGPDLPALAASRGLSTEEVCAIHSAPLYRVFMIGFAPGFPYLGLLDPRLHTARLATPRTRVPAGSVAIGGEHTGIYPIDTPGGWHLIGRTSSRLFDPRRQGGREGAFLLKAGDCVRFVPQAVTQETRKG